MPTLTLNPVTGDLDVVPVNAVSDGLIGLTTIAAGSILAANSLDTLSAITSTSGLKVLKNNAGTTSWNTTTGTGDSVMATSPTFVTDLTTPLAYGSASASGNLQLQSTSNSTRGSVQVVDVMLATTAAQAFAATNGILIDAATGGVSLTTGSVTALRFAPTLTVGGNSAVSLMALFNCAATVKDDGTGRTIGPALIFAGQLTYTATVAGGLTVNDFAGIPGYLTSYHVYTLNRTGAGTGTMTTACGLYISGLRNVGTGWTVTNDIGVLIDAFAGSGTVTNHYGIKNNVNSGTNRWFLHSAGTAQNYLEGRLGLGIAVPLSKLHIEGASNGWVILDEQDSNPTTTELDANDAVAIYSKGNVLTFAYNNAGTMTYVKLSLDGSDTTWSHDTTGP